MNMFDMMRGLASGGDAGGAGLIGQASEFMTQWTKFMQHLLDKLKFIESQLASIDNRTAYLTKELDRANEQLLFIINETNITPELHEGVLAMAQNDPRNSPVQAQ